MWHPEGSQRPHPGHEGGLRNNSRGLQPGGCWATTNIISIIERGCMRIGIKRANPVSRSPTAQADASAAAAWAQPSAELIAVAALLALAVLVATWFSQPSLRISAAEPAASRYLSGFWAVEHTDEGSFRWSQTDATIRLFGLEQRAPVLFQARLSASRKPGQPLAQLTDRGRQSVNALPDPARVASLHDAAAGAAARCRRARDQAAQPGRATPR